LFRQIRQQRRGEPLFLPRGRDVLNYVRALYDAVCSPDVSESAQVQKMKKYLNFIGVGVEPSGQFLYQIRRVSTKADFFRVCEEFLDHDRPLLLEPFPVNPEKAAVAPKEFDLPIDLNLGKAADSAENYVTFNKGDVGDPTSLGG
jgi:hypothetical protein